MASEKSKELDGWAGTTRLDFDVYTKHFFPQKRERINRHTPAAEVKLALLNSAIVILAHGQIPTILHPSFLSSEGIVPAGWQLSEPPLCTPTVSISKYANGITFLLDLTKLIVRDDTQKDTTPLPEVLEKLLTKLPQVRFSGIGINFGAYFERPNPGEWITERFLKKGPGNDAQLAPKASGLKLTYLADPGELNLSCDPGTVQKPGDPTQHECLLTNANYHVSISAANPAESLEQARTAIQLYSKRLAHFTEIANILFG